MQKDRPDKVNISSLIFSEAYGEKSFNMTDDAREECLNSLYKDGEYVLKEDDDETVKNMLERYEDIVQSFPEELSEDALPYFIDWFIRNVVIVEIMAYSDENAYTIFETMNDRGLNLTQSEMLKGFVLSKITDIKQRTEINNLWKEKMQELHEYGENADQSFFQAWFRGKYAQNIRPGKAGSENKDFELIGNQFHNWFKDNHRFVFRLKDSDDFYNFFKNQFPFFVKWFKNIWNANDSKMLHLQYTKVWGIAESLQDPLLLAPVNYGDSDALIKNKIDFTARFIETFTMRRSINFMKFGQTTIKYSMFNIIKLIRGNDLKTLGSNLTNEINNMEQDWTGVHQFYLHGQNRRYVKHLLSRISSYVDNLVGKSTTYASYQYPEGGRQYEIEHIWANKFEEHKDEFEQENEFQEWRNSIGALILLPNGTNQSFSSDKYKQKLKHYIKENTFAQTLHPDYYEKNPNFLKSEAINKLDFKAHPEFKKDDIQDRLHLVERLCETIWSTDYFKIEE